MATGSGHRRLVDDQLPISSKFQLYTFNETAKPVLENTQGAWLEARNVEREYSPGFLKCRASIKTGTLSYEVVDGKLVLTMAGQDKSHELSRPSADQSG